MNSPKALWLALGVSVAWASALEAEYPGDVASDVAVRAEGCFYPPTRLSTSEGVIDSGSSWGHSGPWVEDVDGDGLKDLVVGDFSGLFRFYRNAGSNENPRYAKAVNLQAGGVDAKVPIY